jgi:hypothetical protein
MGMASTLRVDLCPSVPFTPQPRSPGLGLGALFPGRPRRAASAPLSAPVVVEVSDARGQPVDGATVEFVLTSAGDGAEIAPSTTTTDADGRAQAHVLLGSKVGLQTGEARVLLGAAVSPRTTFSALAQAPANDPPRADFDWHCQDLA